MYLFLITQDYAVVLSYSQKGGQLRTIKTISFDYIATLLLLQNQGNAVEEL